MKGLLTGVVLILAVSACSDDATGPATAPTTLVLEAVVVGDGVPQEGATVAAHLGAAKPGDVGCDGSGWIIRDDWSLTTDARGEVRADLLSGEEEGSVGGVALNGCLLLFTSMAGSPDVSSPTHVPVHALWGESDTLRLTLDITHLM